jgi:hypothetical protein
LGEHKNCVRSNKDLQLNSSTNYRLTLGKGTEKGHYKDISLTVIQTFFMINLFRKTIISAFLARLLLKRKKILGILDIVGALVSIAFAVRKF